MISIFDRPYSVNINDTYTTGAVERLNLIGWRSFWSV